MRFYLILIIALSVVACTSKKKRQAAPKTEVVGSKLKKTRSSKDGVEKKTRKKTVVPPVTVIPTDPIDPRRPVLPSTTTSTTTTSTTTSSLMTTTTRVFPGPNIDKKKKHIKRKTKKDAIYCMTKLETSQLMDIHDSPNMHVLYLRVPKLTDYGVESSAVIEHAKLRKSDYVTVQPNVLKEEGKVAVTSLQGMKGISIKFIPRGNNFIESEMEFRVYQDQCLEKTCVKIGYLSPFFNAEGAAYIYLVPSEHPTHFNDKRVSCHFSKEVLELVKEDLFSNILK